MIEKIEKVQEEIVTLSTQCSLAARSAETLKELLKEKENEVDRLMLKLEELYDFLEKQAAAEEQADPIPEPPKPKKAKRGHPTVAPEDRKPPISKEKKKAYDKKRYASKKKEKPEKEGALEQEEEIKKVDVSESIEEINAKARAEGLSYGKYLEKRLIEKQHEEMMAERDRRLADKKEEERRENEDRERSEEVPESSQIAGIQDQPKEKTD